MKKHPVNTYKVFGCQEKKIIRCEKILFFSGHNHRVLLPVARFSDLVSNRVQKSM